MNCIDLKKALEALHSDPELDTHNELKQNIDMIIQAQTLSRREIELLGELYRIGPAHPGELSGTSGRQELMDKGLVNHVIVKGQDGFYACNSRGMWLLKVINEGTTQADSEWSDNSEPQKTKSDYEQLQTQYDQLQSMYKQESDRAKELLRQTDNHADELDKLKQKIKMLEFDLSNTTGQAGALMVCQDNHLKQIAELESRIGQAVSKLKCLKANPDEVAVLKILLGKDGE